MQKIEYVLEIIDRDTGCVEQTETRKSKQAFDRLWRRAVANVNSLKYKLNASEQLIQQHQQIAGESNGKAKNRI